MIELLREWTREGPLEADLCLPATLLGTSLTGLARRPISASNRHFLERRLTGARPLAERLLRARVLPRSLASLLERLDADTLPRFGPVVGEALFALGRRRPPGELVVGTGPPGVPWEDGPTDVIFGPGIGLGDELVAGRLARALERIVPGQVRIASAQAGLWTEGAVYADLGELQARIEAVQAAAGRLVWLDFDPLHLASVLGHRPGAWSVVEVAMGPLEVTAVLRARRRMHTLRAVDPLGPSYYRGIDEIGAWLGLPPPPARVRAPGQGVFVSPFTSKEEPSLERWSTQLSRLGAVPVDVAIDAGPNAGTARFARTLARMIGARARGRWSLAHGDEGTLALADAVQRLRAAALVVTADTYAAHVAIEAGTPSVVLEQGRVEPWRAPWGPHLYLPAAVAPGAAADTIERVARRALGLPEEGGMGTEALRSQHAALREAVAAVERAPGPETWDTLVGRWAAGAATRGRLPLGLRALFSEVELAGLVPAVRLEGPDADERRWIMGVLARIHQSNLYKWGEL